VIDSAEDGRMSWGKRMQPLLLQAAAEDLRLAVEPNADDVYIRRGDIGCTRDAEVHCPDRGPGALETKVCFDFRTWMNKWDGGKRPPVHNEIQLQAQMYVGDGETPFSWGVLACWCAGAMTYWERKPDAELWKLMEGAAGEFLRTVEAMEEPDPFGSPKEVPLLNALYPETERRTVDLTGEDVELAEEAMMYAWARKQETFYKKIKETAAAKFKGLAQGADRLDLPEDVHVEIKTSTSNDAIRRVVPDEHRKRLLAAMGEAGDYDVPHLLHTALVEVLAATEFVKKASTRTTINVWRGSGGGAKSDPLENPNVFG